MKALIAVLIFLSFIQSAIIPLDLDLVLVLIICRCYVRPDKNNLYLAFGFGLLNAFLNTNILGIQSLIYLFLIAATEGLSKSRLAGNAFLIIPLTFILLALNQTVTSFALHESLNLFPKILWEAFLSLPALYLVKIWEERFIVRGGIKLRM